MRRTGGSRDARRTRLPTSYSPAATVDSGMSTSEAILTIDRAVEQSLGGREVYESERDEGHREVYERTIERVGEVGGKDEAERLTTWLENEIRDERRLPDGEEVREKGAEICGEGGGSVSAESLT